MTTLLAVAAAGAAAAGLAGGRAAPRTRLTALTKVARAPRRGLTVGTAATAAAAAVWLSGVPAALVVLTPASALVVTRVVAHRHAAHGASARRAAVVDVVSALAAELRAGATPSRALDAASSSAGPLRSPLRAAARAVAAGAHGPGELRRVAGLADCAGLGYVAAAWQVAADAGGQVAGALDGLVEALEADEAARRDLAAAMAGPRATMLVLALLPLGGVGLGEAVGAHPLQLLVHRPLGWLLATAAAVLDLTGAAWVDRLARGARASP